MQGQITIRPVTQDDVDDLARISSEMSAFYGSPPAHDHDARASMIRTALFDDNQGSHVLVACEEDQLIGLTSFSFVWPATAGSRSLYLKELYVIEAHRSRGIGSQLVDAVKAVGRAHGCTRIDWTVDNTNGDAFGFYDRIGGFTSDKVGYRLLL